MKYWFLDIKIQNGEFEHSSVGVHKGNFNPINYLKDFYGEEAEVDGDTVNFFGGSICCKVRTFREITKQEYNVLSKFI